ncbi:hypothetical protein RBA45_004090 [Cronobacter dublinensis]|nr:hypothetical protein [Cronobacter dublinensis]
MADAVSVNAVVKEAVQQVSIWIPLLSGLGGVAISGVVSFFLARQNHRYTLDREEAGARERLRQAQLIETEKRQKELTYIATELIIILEQYAEKCAAVAGDDGELFYEPNQQAERVPITGYPVPLNFETVTGDWRSLPAVLMFRIRELPLLRVEAMRAIEDALECDFSRDYRYFFRERQFRFSRMGLKAIHLARQLRRECGLPHSRLNESTWSAQPVMLNVLRRERKLRYTEAKEYDLLLRSY